MRLRKGTELGPYKVLEPLGSGGQGEVYRARDERLSRIVAIKVLPSNLCEDEKSLLRFEREARVISSLNHPNICALFDVGQHGSVHFLVMEYLRGRTLGQHLDKRAFKAKEAVGYAIDIASALEAAHREGVVHRDLKPGNVVITQTGVKLLDFGLARLVPLPAPLVGTSATGTKPREITDEGAIVGTISYMAPEQLEGKPTDYRSDLFSFGLILYEMLTGRKAFQRDSRARLISAILNEDPPPISESRPSVSATLEEIVTACLAKDPEERWQSAGDLVRVLRMAQGESRAIAFPSTAASWTRPLLAFVVASLVLAMLTLSSFVAREPPGQEVMRLSLLPPPELGSWERPPALSPDGRTVAFAGTDSSRVPRLWLRSLDGSEARSVSGTEGASQPFWSPDGRFLGFFAEGRLKKVAIGNDAAPIDLAAAPDPRGGSWSVLDDILYAPAPGGGLRRIGNDGGGFQTVTRIEDRDSQQSHGWPQFLPDGAHFLYFVSSSDEKTRGIYWSSVDERESRMIIDVSSSGVFAPPDYLLYLRQSVLLARRFDPGLGHWLGVPIRLARNVGSSVASQADLSLSTNGILLYGRDRGGHQLSWYDQRGRVLSTIAEPEPFLSIGLTRDERWIAASRIDPDTRSTDLWRLDTAEGRMTPLIDSTANERFPVWSPDGGRLVFASDRRGSYDLFQRNLLDGKDQLLVGDDLHADVPTDWSEDGGFIAFQRQGRETQIDLWVKPRTGADLTPVRRTAANERQASFSPDGKWIAYVSDRSSSDEVYLLRGVSDWRVSTDGGYWPSFRADAKEIYYVAPDGWLMAVEVDISRETPSIESPQALFSLGWDAPSLRIAKPYAAASKGRFLVSAPVTRPWPFEYSIVINWLQEPQN